MSVLPASFPQTHAMNQLDSVHGRHSFVPKEVGLHPDKKGARPQATSHKELSFLPLSLPHSVWSGRALIDAHPSMLKPKSDEPRSRGGLQPAGAEHWSPLNPYGYAHNGLSSFSERRTHCLMEKGKFRLPSEPERRGGG